MTDEHNHNHKGVRLMLLAVMTDGELRLYEANEGAGQIDEWGRLRIARDMPHESLARFTMDLANLAGANGHRVEPMETMPEVLAPEQEEVVVHPHPSELSLPGKPLRAGSTVAQTVLAYVADHPGQTATQIGKATGYDRKQVANTLTRSLHMGRVKRIGSDWYGITQVAPKNAKGQERKPQGPKGMIQPHAKIIGVLIMLASANRPLTTDALAKASGDSMNYLGQSLQRWRDKWPVVLESADLPNGTRLWSLTDYGRDVFVPGVRAMREAGIRGFATLAQVEQAVPEGLRANSQPEAVTQGEGNRLGDIIARVPYPAVEPLVTQFREPEQLTVTDHLTNESAVEVGHDAPVGTPE